MNRFHSLANSLTHSSTYLFTQNTIIVPDAKLLVLVTRAFILINDLPNAIKLIQTAFRMNINIDSDRYNCLRTHSLPH